MERWVNNRSSCGKVIGGRTGGVDMINRRIETLTDIHRDGCLEVDNPGQSSFVDHRVVQHDELYNPLSVSNHTSIQDFPLIDFKSFGGLSPKQDTIRPK